MCWLLRAAAASSRKPSLLKAIVLLASWTVTDLGIAAESPRYWTTSAGRRSDVPLTFVRMDGDTVVLEREDNGKTVRLSMGQLSGRDQRYVRDRRDSDPAENASSGVSASSNSDWSQWRGVDRDGKSSATGLMKAWPPSGPAVVWNVTGLGEGYSTPSVVGDSIYVLGTQGDAEALFCLGLDDGQIRWQSPLGQKAGGGGYPGPRGTPTVDGDLIYAIGSDGTLGCFRRDGGQTVWQKNLKRDFGGKAGGWDYAESPLIDGERLICTPGGQSSTVVALQKERGTPLWNGSAAELGEVYCRAAFASPVVAEIAGVRQYVCFLHGGVVGFDAATGKGLWHYDAPANGTANCSTPVIRDDFVFAASAYGTGGGKARVTRSGSNFGVEEVFFVKKFENHHGGFVLVDDHIYGTNNSVLMCIDWNNGDVVWQDRCVGKGSVSFADGHLMVRGERGEVALVEATPTSYVEKGRFMQSDRSDKNAWPHPVIAGGKLLLRDQDRMLAYDIGS